MSSGFLWLKVGLIVFNTLLCLFASFLVWTGKIGPHGPPPDRVVILINGQELQAIEQPVKANIEETVYVKVQVYHQGQLMNPGEFSYQWCFAPPVNDNHICEVDGYRAETNSDYKPETSDEQRLTITIKHNFLRTVAATVLFKPE